ncbi:MAG: hypothetical protein AB9866_01045 [Syntrophobacteraceae bacterium]
MTKTRIILALSLVICIAFTVQVFAAAPETPTKAEKKTDGDATTGVKSTQDPAVKKGAVAGTPTKAESKTAGEADQTIKPKDPKSAPSAPAQSLTPTKEKGKAVGDATTTATPKQ